MKFENTLKDAEAMLKELALHDIPVEPVPTQLQKELRIVAYCYKSAFFRYTSDEPLASPMIHEILHDIVVNNHNGDIGLDYHDGDGEGDVAVLSLPDPRNDPKRDARYIIYRWFGPAPAASCHHLPDSPSSGAGQVRLDVAARPSLSPPPGEALL